METTPKSGVSTPVVTRVTSTSEFISPSTTRRKHIPLTSTSSVLADVPEQDNAALRRQRRQSRVLELQKQLQSPGTPTERRRSLPLSNLNNAQITEHYTNCIKLSAENKINSKNAFGLHLIEFMADLLQSKKGEMTNFQVASCTLDASTKIYAGRVDAIHSDTYKMLGGLGHGDKQSKDGCDEDMDTEGEVKSKTKKRLRHSNTVETNLKNINVNKFDLGFEVDPLFEKTSASFDEGGTYGLLLNHLSCQDDSCELLLDSNIILNEKPSPEDISSDQQIDLTEIEDIYFAKMLDSLQIFTHFEDFVFANWKRNEMEQSIGHKTASQQAFDMAAVPEPLDIEEPFHGPTDQYEGCDFSEDEGVSNFDGDKSVFMADGQESRVISGTSSSSSSCATAGQLCMQLSLQPTEYSYFDVAAMVTWAGPKHWKLKAKTQEEKKARIRKPVFRIDYTQPQDFDQSFKETKVATSLSKATLNKYSNCSNILPQDIHFNPDELFRLFHKPSFTIKRIFTSSEISVDDDIASYDYENENDCANFCPAAADDDDCDDDCGFTGVADQTSIASHGSSFSNDSIFDVTTLQGYKLVAQPHKVNRIDIQYAKTAKKMDVKKLKALMWNHLTNPSEENKENQEMIPNDAKKEAVVGTQSFTNLYDMLPEKLSSTMSKNLSIPIAFVCLLHLANEK
ncbi:putative condensin complex subunit 2, partial [Apostichopus japonicus]